ncbi:uncharacterized protein LOC115885832 [Sitophilus oryzae]|uniref:Uncharacterized protein LOC115885832 n=1 Tax=Sitophilus oryzae TaxID=7048 RepID=A0A6J2YB67_SITOR|nr:uncharacterized protein LOC115885832 [Sitophilus oryzae]
MYLCFVDYEKAFDKLCWGYLWSIVAKMGVPQHLVDTIKSLYDNSQAVMKLDRSTSGICQIRKGVRQGCVLSPMLFNIYSEYIMRIVLEEWAGGVSLNGYRISNLHFVDDTVLVAANQLELEAIITRLETTSRQFGFRINYKKTKVMIVDRENNNRPDITNINRCQVVKQFISLGALISNTGSCEVEIRRRIQLARNAMTQLTKVWSNNHIKKSTKINLQPTDDALTPSRCGAGGVCCEYHGQHIAPMHNVSVLNEIQLSQRLSSTVYKHILFFFGHVNRSVHMERLVVQGRPAGSRRRGRSPTRWVDMVEKLMNTNLEGAVRRTENRENWRRTVCAAVRSLEPEPEPLHVVCDVRT